MSSKIIAFLCGFLLLTSCDKYSDQYSNCDYLRIGTTYAENEYRNLSGYGIYEYMNNDTIYIYGGQKWDDLCQRYEDLDLNYLPLRLNDTIYLKYSLWGIIGGPVKYPTAAYSLIDGDAPYRIYDIADDEDSSSWVILEKHDTAKNTIRCSFQLKVAHYVPDSIGGLGDPNRPDTLIFENGYIDAVLYPK